MNELLNRQIDIYAHAQYDPAQSNPNEQCFLFVYNIVISNIGNVPARLMSRHWIISDALGGLQEIQGQGVVGRQPLLEPGDIFTYSSSCVLPTPVGSMRGSYKMTTADGKIFEALIDEFTLAIPHMLH